MNTKKRADYLSWDEYFMGIAKLSALRSKDPSTQVGACIVSDALEERGYNSENQIAGYLISNDPAYISSHKNARNLIQKIERYEIIEELVRAYLEK